MTFGENLKTMRKSRKITQAEMAKALGVSQTSIASWENGTREPNFETCEAIADFFNVPLSAVIVSRDPATTDLAYMVADSLHKNPKLGLLFDRTKNMNEKDLDVVFSVVEAITKEREWNE